MGSKPTWFISYPKKSHFLVYFNRPYISLFFHFSGQNLVCWTDGSRIFQNNSSRNSDQNSPLISITYLLGYVKYHDLYRVVPRYSFPFYGSSLGWHKMSIKSTQPTYMLFILYWNQNSIKSKGWISVWPSYNARTIHFHSWYLLSHQNVIGQKRDGKSYVLNFYPPKSRFRILISYLEF
jgi:hypothetical protein